MNSSKRNFNSYAYVRNSPLNGTDPSGREDPRCEELREIISELNGHLQDALGENPVNLPDVRDIRDLLAVYQEEYDELGCGDDGDDGTKQTPSSCSEQAKKQAAAAAAMGLGLGGLLYYMLVGGGVAVGL